MPKPRKFYADRWTLVADPPPCDPGNPARALAFCEKVRQGQRCTCQFELATIAEDLEEVGLGEYASEFEDELDSDSLGELVADLLRRNRRGREGPAIRLQEELLLLKRLADQGSGVRPGDGDGDGD